MKPHRLGSSGLSTVRFSRGALHHPAAAAWLPSLCLVLLLPLTPGGFGSIASAATIHVPGDQPTIRLGLQAAVAGDIVVVACGRYLEHDLVLGSGVSLQSETGEPECVTIDARHLGRVVSCTNTGTGTRIEGFTLTGGWVGPPNDRGGAISCEHASVTISHCVMTGNLGYDGGSGIYCLFSDAVISDCRIIANEQAVDGGAVFCNCSSPVISRCLIASNSAVAWGGAVACQASSPRLLGCTLVANAAGANGGGIWCVYDSHPVLENTIIAFSRDGEGVCVYDNPGHQSTVSVSCCDVFGNADGNYAGMADPTGTDGNISVDPGFCGAAGGDYALSDTSPCLPPNNDCGVQIGALGQGCSSDAAVAGGGHQAPPLTWRVANPCERGSAIGFTLSSPGVVSLAVYDKTGRKVSELFRERSLSAGYHQVSWSAGSFDRARLGAGIYFCRAEVGGAVEIRKIVLAP